MKAAVLVQPHSNLDTEMRATKPHGPTVCELVLGFQEDVSLAGSTALRSLGPRSSTHFPWN